MSILPDVRLFTVNSDEYVDPVTPNICNNVDPIALPVPFITNFVPSNVKLFSAIP